METWWFLRMWLLMAVFLFTYNVVGSMEDNQENYISRSEMVNATLGRSLAGKRGNRRPWLGREGLKCKGADGTMCQYSSCGQGRLLPKCAIGFARGVIGGRRGMSYTVTRSDDNPSNPAPGTLRYGVKLSSSNPKGIWITFAHDMTIWLQQILLVFSHTTIDGRGVKVIIAGTTIGLNIVQNVIIHNIQISDSSFDAVHIVESRMVWIDHVTSFNGQVGLISAVQGSTDITVSNCRLSCNHYNMLLGAKDSDTIDKNMRVTIYRNWFKDTDQRNPHCRWGYCHVVNNLYDNWRSYAIGARVYAKIYSEKNVFLARKYNEVTEWYPGYESERDTTPRIQSNGDLLLGAATFHQFLYTGKVDPPPYKKRKQYPPAVTTGKVQHLVSYCSGVLLGKSIRSCFAQR